jgi:threonylcarbamoyladenosine tRNA methylthiotransferase MtaB
VLVDSAVSIGIEYSPERGGVPPATIDSVATFHVENFGCRATQADGAAIERQFESRGLLRTESACANFVILNTCTVTESADQDARAAIRRVQRQNPLAKIIVTGCYAQRAPEQIAALPGVSAVIGNSHKHVLAEITLDQIGIQAGFVPIATLAPTTPQRSDDCQFPFVSDIFAHTELLAAPVFDAGSSGDRTRPNLKIQDGCDNRCSFCVIPSVRGHSRSLPLERVITEANMLVAAGYKELVISGINLGRWGRDLAPGNRLASLIRAMLDKTAIQKLRISSVEPMDWTDDLISLVASSPRIAKHAHVPLQSGSDAVLRRMHRKYRPWHYREKIEKIHATMPKAAVGADVMVGFPGETEAEFEITRRFIEEMPFTYLHVFTYSPRPETPAATMANQVPVRVARERNKILRDLAAEKKVVFMRSFVGETLEAITLNASRAGATDFAGEATECLTDNYQKLYLRGIRSPNQWLQTRIEGVSDGVFLATAI